MLLLLLPPFPSDPLTFPHRLTPGAARLISPGGLLAPCVIPTNRNILHNNLDKPPPATTSQFHNYYSYSPHKMHKGRSTVEKCREIPRAFNIAYCILYYIHIYYIHICIVQKDSFHHAGCGKAFPTSTFMSI